MRLWDRLMAMVMATRLRQQRADEAVANAERAVAESQATQAMISERRGRLSALMDSYRAADRIQARRR